VTAPRYLQIYRQLVEEIREGTLKSGDRVPSEKELADQHGVSRITSKKALEMLAQAHLIERERGRGSFVAPVLPDFTQLDRTTNDISTNGNHRNDHKVIGLVIPDFSDAFGTELVRSIERSCAERGYLLMVKMTYGFAENEFEAIETLTQFGADGLIIFPVHGEYYNSRLVNLILQQYPLVLVDRYLKGLPAYAVYTSNERGAYELTMHLLQNGHRHIAFVSPPSENTSAIEDRLEGYKNALTSQRILVDPAYCFDQMISTMPRTGNPQGVQDDRQRLIEFLHQQPQLTGFFACEYNIAVLLHDVLAELGRIDASEIVCFDSPSREFRAPQFTHIRQDETTLGRTAVDIVASQLEKQQVTMQHVIDYELVVAG
jgi:GntR family transcriptional regulator, arabinose operon transcriptional repressor